MATEVIAIVLTYQAALLQAAWETVAMTLLALAGELPLGVGAALLFATGRRGAGIMGFELLLAIFRNVPLRVVLFFVHYVIVGRWHPALSPWTSASVVLFLLGATYFCHVFRSALASFDTGQLDAARALALRWSATVRLILLP